ncbi:MAG: hypothetical protein WC310_04090 [Patescibacteria group bacterium]|jgi:hypothetical protein
MTDINLLPEELRSDDKKRVKDQREEIVYTDPAKQNKFSKEIKPITSKVGWWKNFLFSRKDRKQLKKQDSPVITSSKPQTINDKNIFSVPKPPEIPKTIYTQTPRENPSVMQAQKIEKTAMPNLIPPISYRDSATEPKKEMKQTLAVKKSWWSRFWHKFFFRKTTVQIKPREILMPAAPKVGPARDVSDISLVSPAVKDSSEKINLDSTVMHEPQNHRLRGAPEVDLASDESFLFTWSEFYHRLQVGGIVLLLAIIFLVAIYFAIARVMSPSSDQGQALSANIAALEKQLTDFEKKKGEVVLLDRRLAQLNSLAEKHLFWSRLFVLLEKDTLANVYYTSMTVDQSGKIIFSVSAPDYPILAQQLAIWQSEPLVSSVEFSSATIDENTVLSQDSNAPKITTVRFDLVLNLNPEFLAK